MDVETHVEVKGKKVLTRVRWFVNSKSKEICTRELTPHDDCTCDRALHPKNIKFKLNRRETQKGNDELDLHLWCDLNVPVESDVEESDIKCTRKKTIHYETGKEKWQYICTYLIGEDVFNYTILLTLKSSETLTEAVKIFSSELRLCDDMEQLLSDKTYTDSILFSKEGIPFKVHRAILAKRSEVFRAMFEYDHIRNKSMTTTLYEDVLSELLNFIYTGRAPNVMNMAGDLLFAADYYQLFTLKNICMKVLHHQLTPENAITTLEMAEKYSYTELVELTLGYIKEGHAGSVIKSEGWKNIKSMDLVKKLFEVIADIADTNQSKK